MCCVVPQELSSFAKENNVNLVTHSDPEVKYSFSFCQDYKLQKLNKENSFKHYCFIAIIENEQTTKKLEAYN